MIPLAGPRKDRPTELHGMNQPSESSFAVEPPSRASVVVVGGGIAGTSAAYHIAREGVDVVLLEQRALGGGATATAVGVLSPPMRQPFDETAHFRGEAVARTVWEFALRSVQGLGTVLEARGEAAVAGLDLSGGYVLAQPHTEHQVQGAHGALTKAGLPVTWMTADEVAGLTESRGFGGGYRIEGLGALNPGPTTVALARAAASAGARVVEGVRVRGVERDAGSFLCLTEQGDVRADMVVYATHVDSRRFSAFLGDEIVPMRGQGMAAGPRAPTFRGAFATHWKLNVWRSDAAGRLILGGWRHDAWDRSYYKARPALDHHLQSDLQRWFEAAFPGYAPLSVENRWSGIFGWTADYLPLVGPLPGRPGELVISGFSGGGLPFAFEAGRVIASIICETEAVAGADLLRPHRFT